VTVPFRRIRHLLVDLDGVLYRGPAPLPDAQRFMSWLRARNVSFRLVTNNATLTPVQYVEKLAGMGIEVRAEDIFTSALATALYLDDHGTDGRRAFVIGEDGLLEALRAVDVEPVDIDPQWVVVGLDRRLTYQKLATAALALESGARFVGTNPDTSYPTESGLVPGAGAILAALRVTTGVEPVIIGKPQPLMLELATRQLGGTKRDTAMLGDRLDTDIAGAAAAGMPSILVLTGVSTRSDLSTSPDQPSLVVNTLGELMSVWEKDADGAGGSA
jgi:4-nitrophenyl phosphatase